jgi:hypothetical protein
VAIRFPGSAAKKNGLPRRCAPRNDGLFSAFRHFMRLAELTRYEVHLFIFSSFFLSFTAEKEMANEKIKG